MGLFDLQQRINQAGKGDLKDLQWLIGVTMGNVTRAIDEGPMQSNQDARINAAIGDLEFIVEGLKAYQSLSKEDKVALFESWQPQNVATASTVEPLLTMNHELQPTTDAGRNWSC